MSNEETHMLRRTPFRPKPSVPLPKRDRSEEFASHVSEPRRAVMAAGIAEQAPVVIHKVERYRSEAWRRAVASLDCVLCGKSGETQCAHRNEDKGAGMKVDDCWTAALCVECHRSLDQGTEHYRIGRRQMMDKAILLTLLELARQGRVVPK